MPTDKLGQTYGPGDLVAVAMANGSPSNQPNLVFVVVEEILTHDAQGRPFTQDRHFDPDTRQLSPAMPGFVVKGRPYAEGNPHTSYGSLGPDARLRQYIKPGNIIALSGFTTADIRDHASPKPTST